MNYKHIHDNIIARAKFRNLTGYLETHHIIPRCMGGTDDDDNLVKLTPEEHYIVHQLLIKIHDNNPALVYAAHMMIPNRPSNKLYGWIRRRYQQVVSNAQSGSGNTQFGTFWVSNGMENKKLDVGMEIPDGWFKGRKFPPKLNHKIKCKCDNRVTKKNKCDARITKKETPLLICQITGEKIYDVQEYRLREWSNYPPGRIRTINLLANVFEIQLGNKEASTKLTQAKEMLRADYEDSKISTLEIHKKYSMSCAPSHVSNLLKSLGIKRRTFSEAGKNYQNNAPVAQRKSA